MKQFYEFAMEQGWIQFVLMFIGIASFIEIGYVGVTVDINSLITYGMVIGFIWISYFMLMGTIYDKQRIAERNHLLKKIFAGMETEKPYTFFYSPPDVIYMETDEGEYYLKICEVEEVRE